MSTVSPALTESFAKIAGTRGIPLTARPRDGWSVAQTLRFFCAVSEAYSILVFLYSSDGENAPTAQLHWAGTAQLSSQFVEVDEAMPKRRF